MPRQIKEVKNFHTGIVMNADTREAPEDSAVYSSNVDSNAPNGVLAGNRFERYKDGSINYAKYLVDSTARTTAAFNNTATSFTVDNITYFEVGDWVSIAAFAW